MYLNYSHILMKRNTGREYIKHANYWHGHFGRRLPSSTVFMSFDYFLYMFNLCANEENAKGGKAREFSLLKCPRKFSINSKRWFYFKHTQINIAILSSQYDLTKGHSRLQLIDISKDTRNLNLISRVIYLYVFALRNIVEYKNIVMNYFCILIDWYII
jgi:uncharacterized C2H2 Zn-finger protein